MKPRHCRPRVAGSAASVLIMGAVLQLQLGTSVAAPLPLGSSPVTCGSVITQDTTLTADLVDCPADGLLIGADNIVLNLNGHLIDGVQTGQSQGDADGVDNSAGHDGVTIKNGRVRAFASGVYLDGGARANRILGVNVAQSYVGIDVARSSSNLVRSNVTQHNALGIGLLLARDNRVEGNTALSRDFGIFLDNADGNRVAGNSVRTNTFGDGIDLFRGSKFNTVINNSVLGDSSSAMQINGASYNTISSNFIGNTGPGGGIDLFGGRGNVLEHNYVEGRRNQPGFFLAGSSGNRLEGNTSVRNAIGIALIDGANQNTVVENVTVENTNVGIGVEGTSGTVLSRNVASRNVDSGIVVRDPGTVLTANMATQNGGLGIDAVPDVFDGGGNIAHGNGDPAQCTGVVCSTG